MNLSQLWTRLREWRRALRRETSEPLASWQDYVERHGDQPATVTLLGVVFAGLLKGMQEQSERIAALEAKRPAPNDGGVPREPPRKELTARETAILLMAALENKGAVFTTDPTTGHFLCDLNPAFSDPPPEWIPQAVLGLRTEISQLLAERETAVRH